MTNQGQASEQLAVEYLQTQGVLILARNLRCKAGELDLVALDGDVLAVIEVRQRGGDSIRRRARLGHAAQAAQDHSRRRLLSAAADAAGARG